MTFPDSQFQRDDVEILQENTVYKGFFRMQKIRLRHRLFEGGWSPVIERELMRRGEAVGVIPYDPEHGLIGLVEQFRVGGIDRGDHWMFELVAGMRDGDELPEQTAARELMEEAGIEARSYHEICDCWVSPGGTDETVRLYCGIADLSQAGGVFGMPGEHEDIRFHVLPEAQVFEAFEQGRCNNAATVIALLWLQLHRGRWQ